MFFIIAGYPAFSTCNEDDSGIPQDNKYEGSIVIVPDIQYYTNEDKNFKYLDTIVDYCNDNLNDISFLLQTGDITNNNEPWQWKNGYERFFSKLSKKFPAIYCLGNHDYGENGKSEKRESNFVNELIPTLDEVMPGSQWDNYLRYVYIGQKKLAVLSLEFATRNIVLEWADRVIKANANIPVIILTHAFLNNSGQMFDTSDPSCDNNWTPKQYKMGGDYINDSKEIFDKIVYNNSNVKIVVCGHCISNNYIECLEKNNASGGKVYCVMVNYQHYKDGGAGYIGLLYYDKNNHVNLRSYDTVNNTYGKTNIYFDLNI